MADKKIPVRDITLFQSDLEFFPPEGKNEVWLAEYLFFSKKANVQFLDFQRWKKYSALDRLEINSKEYINMVDPPTPMGGGGRAEYFASAFKDIPIAQHL